MWLAQSPGKTWHKLCRTSRPCLTSAPPPSWSLRDNKATITLLRPKYLIRALSNTATPLKTCWRIVPATASGYAGKSCQVEVSLWHVWKHGELKMNTSEVFGDWFARPMKSQPMKWRNPFESLRIHLIQCSWIIQRYKCLWIAAAFSLNGMMAQMVFWLSNLERRLLRKWKCKSLIFDVWKQNKKNSQRATN